MRWLATFVAEAPIEPDVQTYGIWGLASAVVTGVVVLVSKLIERRTGSRVLREDVPESAADNAQKLTDIARGMVEDIARRLEAVEKDLADERAERNNQQRIWRAFAHSVQVWASQAQAAAHGAGITLPPPPDSPMEH